jgi:hypothetical protein
LQDLPYRVSVGTDHVLSDLKSRFAEILDEVERQAGWETKRLEPPVMILGHFEGVRTGIRQLIRAAPLETTIVRGLKVPTVEEMLRIKAYRIVRRNAKHDFVDFVALFDHLGVHQSLAALATLDRLYPQQEGASITRQLVLQLSEPNTDWQEVARRAFSAGQKITMKILLRER